VFFAAASLTDSMKEVASAYEKASGDRVVFQFWGIEYAGAADRRGGRRRTFSSRADEAKMDGLESKGLIEKGTRKNRLSNSLVIIVATENGAAVRSPKDLASADVKRVAFG